VLRRILLNMSWSSAEQLLRMVFGLVTSIWLARYLGPAQFGTYSLVLGIVAMASTLVPLLTDQILQREVLAQPGARGEIVGTGLAMRLVGSTVAMGVAGVAIMAVRPEQPGIAVIAIMAGGSLAFYPAEIFTAWFMSQLSTKHVFIGKVPPLVVVFALRVGLFLMAAPLVAFVGVAALEAVLCAFGLAFAYRVSGERLSSLAVSISRARVTWRDSWPLLLAGIGTMLYLKIDIVMLAALHGDQELGIYGAATRLSEVWYAVPMIVGISLQPLVFALRAEQPQRYLQTRTALYGVMAWGGIAIGAATCVIATPVCILLFGPHYAASGFVLSVHIWSVVPMFLMVTSGCFLVAEHQGGVSLVRTAIGLAMNVVLNLMFIPSFGAIGAAYATVLSYTCAAFCVVLVPASRPHAAAMLRAVSFAGLRDALAFSTEIGRGLGYAWPAFGAPKI
jgi:polysaccharide transporter, PST family